MERRSLLSVALGGLVVAVAGGVAWGQATAAGLEGIVAPGAQPVRVQGGFQFLEGPVTGPDGSLFFSDVRGNRIYRRWPDGPISLYRENTDGANGLAFDPRGRMLAAEGGGGRIIAMDLNRIVTPLATQFGSTPLVRPNDLIPDRKGGVYFTDPGGRPAAGETAMHTPAVYYLRPTGEVLLVDNTVARPNGITLSLDGRTLLVADSWGENILAYDVQRDGTVLNRRTFAQLSDIPKTGDRVESGADGMAVDSEGRVYVTTVTGIQVFDPNGAYLGTIAVPKQPSNIAFGGPDRRTLFITARDTLYRLPMLAQGPKDRAK